MGSGILLRVAKRRGRQQVQDESSRGGARRSRTIRSPLQVACAIGLATEYDEWVDYQDLKAVVGAPFVRSAAEHVDEAVELVVRLRTAARDAVERAWPSNSSENFPQAMDRALDRLRASFPSVATEDLDRALTQASGRHLLGLAPEERVYIIQVIQEQAMREEASAEPARPAR